MKLSILLASTAITLSTFPTTRASEMENLITEQFCGGGNYVSTSSEHELGIAKHATTEISENDIYLPLELRGLVRLVHNTQEGFVLLHANGNQYPIKLYNIRGIPKRIPVSRLTNGDFYFKIKEINSSGQYALDVNARLRGGGPKWDGFKTWLVGPHPGWHVFVGEVLPKIGNGTVAVVTTAIDAVREIKKH